MLLGISILACLFVHLMNLLPVQSEVLASTWVGARQKGRAPGGMRPGFHVGKGRLSGSFTQQLEVARETDLYCLKQA